MIPRYRPQLAPIARLAALQPLAALSDEVAKSLGIESWSSSALFDSGRSALAAYFGSLAALDQRRTVVVSCQICPVVPIVLIAQGFRPIFADTDTKLPTPGRAETLAAFSEGGGERHTAAVLFSPFYGHMPSLAGLSRRKFGSTRLVADLAQGVLIEGAMHEVLGLADAAMFSFGPGKGLDIGGALLAERQKSSALDLPPSSFAPIAASTFAMALALRAIQGLGLYRRFLQILDRKVDSAKEWSGHARRLASFGPSRGWRIALRQFSSEVQIARQRAANLFSSEALLADLKFPEAYGGRAATHLRQVIRLRDSDRRDAVLAALRARGIDAMPAGEPLPESYLSRDNFAGNTDWPNARLFLADAIRLPFLGRLTATQFKRLQEALEDALA